MRKTVEDVINVLLDEEADLLLSAERYKRVVDHWIGKRTRVIGMFHDSGSALKLITAKVKYVVGSE